MRRSAILIFPLILAGVALGLALFFSRFPLMQDVSWPAALNERSEPFYHPVQPYLLNGKEILLERVTSSEAMMQGLGDRPSMEPDHGMLFLYQESAVHPFWMRHMQFPIDIIWIEDGVVVDIAHRLPPPKDALDVPVSYTPKGVSRWVLEVPAGQAEAYDLSVGGKATIVPIP